MTQRPASLGRALVRRDVAVPAAVEAGTADATAASGKTATAVDLASRAARARGVPGAAAAGGRRGRVVGSASTDPVGGFLKGSANVGGAPSLAQGGGAELPQRRGDVGRGAGYRAPGVGTLKGPALRGRGAVSAAARGGSPLGCWCWLGGGAVAAAAGAGTKDIPRVSAGKRGRFSPVSVKAPGDGVRQEGLSRQCRAPLGDRCNRDGGAPPGISDTSSGAAGTGCHSIRGGAAAADARRRGAAWL